MAWHGRIQLVRVVFAPILAVMAKLAALGVGIWLSALSIRYRGVRDVMTFLVQIWLFLSPVIYPMTEVAPRLERWGLPVWSVGLNPLVGVIERFRWAVSGTDADPTGMVVVGCLTAVAILVSGLGYFRPVEQSIADVV